MLLNENYDLFLPLISDFEKNEVYIKMYSDANFLTLKLNPNIIEIKPTSPVTNLGDFIVRVVISDSREKSDYFFSIKVINNPPYFANKLTDIKIGMY